MNPAFSSGLPNNTRPFQKNQNRKFLILGLIGLLILAVGGVLFAYSLFLDPGRQAYQRCQTEISAIVYSPETAVYETYTPQIVNKADEIHYIVNISVKAANKNGVMVPSKFTCYMTYSSWKWSVESIESRRPASGSQE